MEQLVQWSYDRYTNIELVDGEEEEKEEDTYRVHPHDIMRANQLAGPLLLKIVSGEMLLEDDLDDERSNRAARLLAHLSGRGGFKTWGAAPLLAKKLLQQNIIPDIASRDILELGTGTGMVGLVCDKMGAQSVQVTDYHPSVLENVAVNVALNEAKATVSKLDFVEVANSQAPEWIAKRFDIVIASDLLYEMEHAENLPVAVDMLMENEFYFMIPLRDTHWPEVHRFEEKMEQLGLQQRLCIDSERQEEEGIVRYRYYEYTRLP
ncbi:putative methyltransferase-domain-containing protein [Radiomyces spectabilis]|uniref:putative methyltransferase-domain-containing protein n=1 Tax=Radiomyces spectabilis TaxID=64574 RepID=UPI002220CBA0|nr:putative methyltransferase-domain-containing protein [Radiomyces spectabilis]KAI8364796.1 putative methyltransferase-domain-containing protein [Radiomyces spectabilis]